ERVAAANGLENLTMEHVAQDARLSRGLLYVYFQDKHDLEAGICERALIGLHARFEGAMQINGTGLARVVAMGRAYVAFAEECPLQFDILARFEATDGSAPETGSHHSACLAAGARVHDLLAATLEVGMGDGSIASQAGSPNTIALSLWAMLHGTLQVAKMKGAILAQHAVTPEALVEQTLRMATTSLRRGE
ncbi:MAG: TetR/AcrR family transcriptional regulator, partial [Gammaproteobacteria bacterium]